jgi:hypothetical protein
MKKNNIINYRQGDVFMVSSPMPKGAIKSDNRIVAKGEFSDHSHVITGDAEIYEDNGRMYVSVGKKGAKLQHTLESKLPKSLISNDNLEIADHEIIELPANTNFEVVIQNEYNPYSKLFEQVRD